MASKRVQSFDRQTDRQTDEIIRLITLKRLQWFWLFWDILFNMEAELKY